MTREEARKSAKVMLAYADGKDIEYCSDGKNWDLCKGEDDNYSDDLLGFDFSRCKYRIKKEPIYRPFKDKEECWAEMQKHQPFGWLKYTGVYINIAYIDNKGISYLPDSDFESLDYTTSLKYMKFADGTPFGIREE